MSGHKITKAVRMKLRAGQRVAVRRGWRREELQACPASAVRRIDPPSGKVAGEIVVVPTRQLRLTARARGGSSERRGYEHR